MQTTLAEDSPSPPFFCFSLHLLNNQGDSPHLMLPRLSKLSFSQAPVQQKRE